MSYYLVRFSIGQNSECVYPESVRNVVWKNTTYHFSQRVMVGQTGTAVNADGRNVVALTPREAVKRMKQLQEGFHAPVASSNAAPTLPLPVPRNSKARKRRAPASSKR